jgi:hypothetical protein
MARRRPGAQPDFAVIPVRRPARAAKLPKGTVFPSAYRQVVRTFSQARAVRP